MDTKIVLVKEGGEGYYEEKKSRFLAAVYPVKEETEALRLIEAARKKYWDARHNCYAFVIGRNNELARYSDDGEPSGTAGRPILEVIQAKGIRNCLVVVTRYFGGTLLGAGNLVRAYRKAAADGLEKSRFVQRIMGNRIAVTADYNSAGKIQHMAEKNGYIIEDIKYGADVKIALLVQEARAKEAVKAVTEITAGKAPLAEEKGVEIYTEISNGRS